jgi:hypothetical protein
MSVILHRSILQIFQLVTAGSIFIAFPSHGQDPHEHHQPQHDQHDTVAHFMPHAYSLELPMTRNTSGTAWLPDNTPMFGHMAHSGKWMFMGHGNVFLRYGAANVNNPDLRGDDMLDAPNWFMGMAQRRIGRNGQLAFTAMISLDPWTIGGAGYPLLFQTGETWQGRPLIDRQHPHDLFSALSAGYTHRFAEGIEATAYVGYPGEPTIGPPAFMHRISALSDPNAPLGHHWQDATHIVFGVATFGLRYKWLAVQGSSFTGREPDEERFGFDRPRFDSRSTRMMVAPSPNWSLQASTAYIQSPEVLTPEVNVRRSTASVMHVHNAANASWNSAAIWGMNDAGEDHVEHSLLFETARVTERGNTYLRYEWIQLSPHELGLEDEIPHHNGHAQQAPVNALSIGHSQRLLSMFHTELFLGGQLTGYLPDPQWQPFYGETPLSFAVYLRLTPARMRM